MPLSEAPVGKVLPSAELRAGFGGANREMGKVPRASLSSVSLLSTTKQAEH